MLDVIRVVLLVPIAGRYGQFVAGQSALVPREVGERWVADGIADLAEDPKADAPEIIESVEIKEAVESAEVAPEEVAVQNRPQPRKGRRK